MFKVPELDVCYRKNGYVTFDILPEDVIAKVREVYQTVASAHHQVPDKFKGSSRIEDPAIINSINDKLGKLIDIYLSNHFQDCSSLGYNFLVKEPGVGSEIGAHQDWTYVDETRYSSCNVWIALEDMTISNGCLWVVSGSHLIGHYLRAAPAYPVPFEGISRFVEKFSIPVQIKAGSCVCFNNKTIHGSFVNNSGNVRLAVVTTMFPRQARLLHYYIHNNINVSDLMEYELEPKVFLNLKKGYPPPAYLNSKSAVTHYPVYSKLQFTWQLFKARLYSCFL